MTQTENTITALQVFEQGLTKSAIKEMANNAVESVLEQGNPLTVAEAITAMEAFISEVKADRRFKEYVREETAKNGKQYISPSGAKVELAEVGTSYDFSNCNDDELDLLEVQFASLKVLIDKRKAFLKNIPIDGIDHLDKGSGELEKIYPPSKTSTSSYKITLAR